MQAPPQNASAQASTSTTVTTTKATRTERYHGEHAGGEARKEAEAKGEEQVKIFETKVQRTVRSIGVCPMYMHWYNLKGGYLCGGGHQFICHSYIDKAIKDPRWRPEVTLVKAIDGPEVGTHRQNDLDPSPTC